MPCIQETSPSADEEAVPSAHRKTRVMVSDRLIAADKKIQPGGHGKGLCKRMQHSIITKSWAGLRSCVETAVPFHGVPRVRWSLFRALVVFKTVCIRCQGEKGLGLPFYRKPSSLPNSSSVAGNADQSFFHSAPLFINHRPDTGFSLPNVLASSRDDWTVFELFHPCFKGTKRLFGKTREFPGFSCCTILSIQRKGPYASRKEDRSITIVWVVWFLCRVVVSINNHSL